MVRTSEKGSILVMALWALVFLSLLTIIFSGVAQQAVRFARIVESRKQLYDISHSGAVYAIKAYMENKSKDPRPFTDSLSDWWADDAHIFGQRKIGHGSFVLEYTHVDSLTGKERIRYGLRDENRKININRASKEILKRLFTQVAGLGEERAEKISLSVIDWRDRDDILYNQEGNPSEKEFYRRRGYTYSPPNRDLIEIEELLMVHGVDREIYLKVAPYVTVHGTGKVNVNTAPREVFLVLGMSPALADKIIALRAGEDRTEGTDEDHVFTSERRVLSELEMRDILTDAEKDEMRNVLNQGILTTRSDAYKAVSVSELPHTTQRGVAVCVFDRSGSVNSYSFRLKRAERAL